MKGDNEEFGINNQLIILWRLAQHKPRRSNL